MNKRSPESQSAEFDKFRELTKKLVAVPKSEIDQKRKAFENKKKRESEKK